MVFVSSYKLCLCRIGIEIASAALEVVESVDLSGHFQFATIDGIVPSFDVNRSLESVPSEFGDDFGPIAFAESWGSVESELLGSIDSVLGERVPMDRCIFAVDMEEALSPFPELRHWVDELHHLVAGFPFESDVVHFDCVEHQFPSGWIDGDIE